MSLKFGPVIAKFYLEPPWEGGTKICSQHLGHMTKMATMPIYGINPSKIFFSDFHEIWYVALELLPIIVSSNDDPGVTLTYFMAGQIW